MPTRVIRAEPVEPQPENQILTCHDNIPNLRLEDVPSSFIVKDSWPLLIRNTEAAMYRDAQGLFGIPEVLGSYNVKGPNRKVYLTKNFIPADSEPWNLFRHKDLGNVQPEERIQSRHLFRTEGRDLLDASSPQELLEGILHSIIGP